MDVLEFIGGGELGGAALRSMGHARGGPRTGPPGRGLRFVRGIDGGRRRRAAGGDIYPRAARLPAPHPAASE